MRNFLDHGLYAKHALWAAKAAKSGGALHVRLAAVADDLEVRQVVAVVYVQQGAVVHRARVVGAVAAARGQHHINAQDATAVIEAAVVVDAKVVALAGDHHVVVAIDAQLDRALELEGGQCRTLREDAGVALLAAKAAAHAPADHLDIVGREVQRSGRLALVAVRMLGRNKQRELVVLARHGVGNLAFQVKLFLLAATGASLDAVRRASNFLLRLAACDALGRHDEALLCQRVIDAQNGGQLLDRDLGTPGRLARAVHAARYDHRHRLTEKLHLAMGQKRIVMNDGAAVVLTRNVAGGEDGDNIALGQQRRAVNAFTQQFAVCHR